MQHPSEHTKDLASIVREETDDGRLIVRFLVDAMQGRLQGSKPCHRLDACRQLVALGFDDALDHIPDTTGPARRNGALTPRASNIPASLDRVDRVDKLDKRLAELIRKETDDGRAAVRFLVDVMQGTLDGFKPRHRLAAAKELLRRGFPKPADAPTSPRQAPSTLDRDAPASGNGRRPQYDSSRRYGSQSSDNPKDYDDIDLDDYSQNLYERDCYGHKALLKIYGSENAVSAANRANFEYRISMTENEKVALLTEDPNVESCYGYNALLYIFGSKAAVIAANKGAAEYNLRKRQAPVASPPTSPSTPPEAHEKYPTPSWNTRLEIVPQPPDERSRGLSVPALGAGLGSVELLADTGEELVHHHPGGAAEEPLADPGDDARQVDVSGDGHLGLATLLFGEAEDALAPDGGARAAPLDDDPVRFGARLVGHVDGAGEGAGYGRDADLGLNLVAVLSDSLVPRASGDAPRQHLRRLQGSPHRLAAGGQPV